MEELRLRPGYPDSMVTDQYGRPVKGVKKMSVINEVSGGMKLELEVEITEQDLMEPRLDPMVLPSLQPQHAIVAIEDGKEVQKLPIPNSSKMLVMLKYDDDTAIAARDVEQMVESMRRTMPPGTLVCCMPKSVDLQIVALNGYADVGPPDVDSRKAKAPWNF
jgi:hypothetical protein